MGRCNASVAAPRQAPGQQRNQQPGGGSWQWGLLAPSNMERLCQPGLKCSGFIHPHVANKMAGTCVQIRAASAILLLQAATNHTRHAKKQVWKAAGMKRLWEFKHGD